LITRRLKKEGSWNINENQAEKKERKVNKVPVVFSNFCFSLLAKKLHQFAATQVPSSLFSGWITWKIYHFPM